MLFCVKWWQKHIPGEVYFFFPHPNDPKRFCCKHWARSWKCACFCICGASHVCDFSKSRVVVRPSWTFFCSIAPNVFDAWTPISCKFYFSALIWGMPRRNDLACLTCRETAICMFVLVILASCRVACIFMEQVRPQLCTGHIVLFVTLCHLTAVCLEKAIYMCPWQDQHCCLAVKPSLVYSGSCFCTCRLCSAVALHRVLSFSGTRRLELIPQYNLCILCFSNLVRLFTLSSIVTCCLLFTALWFFFSFFLLLHFGVMKNFEENSPLSFFFFFLLLFLLALAL